MAQLYIPRVKSFAEFLAERPDRIKVGNNRWIAKHAANGYLHGTLHGHAIFELTDAGELTLDHCGYRTVTTRNAMRDFGRLFGIPVGVSFAGGGFTARIAGEDYVVGFSGMISAKVEVK